jgi:hypothetical protein
MLTAYWGRAGELMWRNRAPQAHRANAGFPSVDVLVERYAAASAAAPRRHRGGVGEGAGAGGSDGGAGGRDGSSAVGGVSTGSSGGSAGRVIVASSLTSMSGIVQPGTGRWL